MISDVAAPELQNAIIILLGEVEKDRNWRKMFWHLQAVLLPFEAFFKEKPPRRIGSLTLRV